MLELAGLGPAPFGTMLLADMGADVVRVVRPGTEPTHGVGSVLDRGKRSVELDLKSAEGRETSRALIDAADVLVDPFRPGVLERLGLGPEECLASNPRLIYARMTGWGQEGPLAGAAGHDVNYIAVAGALAHIGPPERPPTVPLNLIGDYGGGGMFLVFGVIAALFERASSNRGQVVDVAMVDGVASLLAVVCDLSAVGNWSTERGTNWLDGSAHWYATYETRDGRFLSVGALEPQFYAELLATLRLPAAEWPQWESARWAELSDRIAEIFRGHTLAYWCAAFEGRDACFAPVVTFDELDVHPHLSARGTFIRRDGVVQPAPAPRFSRTPGGIPASPERTSVDALAIIADWAVAANADRPDG